MARGFDQLKNAEVCKYSTAQQGVTSELEALAWVRDNHRISNEPLALEIRDLFAIHIE